MNEAIATLRRRSAGTTPSSTPDKEKGEQTGAGDDAATEQKRTNIGTTKERSDTTETKPVILLQLLDKGKLDGKTGYEALKAGGYTRVAWEHLKPEIETSRDILSA